MPWWKTLHETLWDHAGGVTHPVPPSHPKRCRQVAQSLHDVLRPGGLCVNFVHGKAFYLVISTAGPQGPADAGLTDTGSFWSCQAESNPHDTGAVSGASTPEPCLWLLQPSTAVLADVSHSHRSLPQCNLTACKHVCTSVTPNQKHIRKAEHACEALKCYRSLQDTETFRENKHRSPKYPFSSTKMNKF